LAALHKRVTVFIIDNFFITTTLSTIIVNLDWLQILFSSSLEYNMETLWAFSGAPAFFLSPDARMLVNETGQLSSPFSEYQVKVSKADDFRSHLKRAKMLILVAEANLFDQDILAAIPQSMPKLVVVSDRAPALVRQQLNALGPEGYVFGVIQSSNFSAAIYKAFSDKVALNQIHSELQKYTDLAFTAMTSASEMGVVALFAERTQSVMDISRLAELAIGCFKDLSVEGIVQFSFDNSTMVFPESASESYRQLLRSACSADARIISHGRFLVFSFTHVQLLIIDAPVDDAERYGRLRDILAPIVSITEARLKTLKVNLLLKEQQNNTRMVMMLLERASVDNRHSMKVIMTDLSLSLRETAVSLELSLAQESALMSLSENALNSLESLQEATAAVEMHFRSLLAVLDSASQLLDQVDPDASSEKTGNKIELF
jgi:hypothetical protein